MSCRHLVLVLGDQLNLDSTAFEDFDPAVDHVLMVEAASEAEYVWNHKARIAIFIAAMRHFAEALRDKSWPLTYLKLGDHAFASLPDAWTFHFGKLTPEKIIVCEPGEYRLEQSLKQLCRELAIPLLIRDDLHFMCSRAEFQRWAGKGKSLRMEFFYRLMRKQHKVLMDGDGPAGGAWNFDSDNRQSFGKQGPGVVPEHPVHVKDTITQQAIHDVEQFFPQHPGSLAHFNWPVNRQQALESLTDFIDKRLADFGPHQDAMWQKRDHEDSPFLWHSLLSSSLNLKLLNPREVIVAAEQAYRQRGLPLQSVEGFIRQILGWREFMRGVYWLEMPELAKSNHYQHARPLPKWYWTGETQMNCLRQTIKQTLDYGYAHHIQRLMVTGLFGLLAEIDPHAVHEWYLAVYVDAVEWVEMPNTIGMALYANGGRITTKPYVASGAYIKRMSNYCQHCRYRPELKTGPQACPFTTLYWHFMIKHQEGFATNPRTILMAKHVDKLSDEEKGAIASSAHQALNSIEQL